MRPDEPFAQVVALNHDELERQYIRTGFPNLRTPEDAAE